MSPSAAVNAVMVAAVMELRRVCTAKISEPSCLDSAANRTYPLIAGAAISLILVSLVGIAAITGFLPISHAMAGAPAAVQTAPMAAQLLAAAPAPAPIPVTAQPVLQQLAVAPAVADEGVKHKAVVHHHPTQAQPSQPYAQVPTYQQQPAPAVAQNSPIGIGVGAVVGGLLGQQIGGGKGKTLATIAAAVGGGYVSNEIAKRNP